MNEPYHTWMSLVTHEWVTSHVHNTGRVCVCVIGMSLLKGSCHNAWAISHMNESCHAWVSHVTYGWTSSTAHVWHGRVAFERVRSQCISHISHMNESWHIWMSHVTYEWVIWHMNESCHIWVRHGTMSVRDCVRTCGMRMMRTNASCRNASVISHMNKSCRLWGGYD